MGIGTAIVGSPRLLSGKLVAVIGCLRACWEVHGEGVLFRRIVQVFTTNMVMAIMGLASGLLAARLLGPQGRGELAAIQSWPMLFAAIALLGMPEAVIYYSSRCQVRAADYLGTARVIALIAGVGFLASGWVLMPALLRSQARSTIWFAQVYLLMIPLYALIELPRNALRAVGAWGAWNALRLVHMGLWLAVVVGAWITSRLATPGALACLFLGMQVLFAVPHSVVVSHYIPGSYTWAPRFRGSLFKFGIPTMLTILPQTLNLRLDQLLMASFLGPQPLGYYVVAVAWAGASSPVYYSIGAVFFPHMSAMHEPRNHHRFLRVYSSRVLLLVSSTTMLLLAVTPMAIRLLFGPEFRPSIPAALILTIASGFSGLNLLLSAGLQGFGKPKSILKAELLGLAVTSVSLVVLLPALGIVGAAISSILSYSISMISLILSILQLRVDNMDNLSIEKC